MLQKPNQGEQYDPDVPLTAVGALFDRGDNFRSIVSFFPNGRLLVSRSHIANPQVLSFIEEVKLYGFETVSVEPVDIGVIATT